MIALLAFPAPAQAFEVKTHDAITKQALAQIRVTISGREYGFTDKALLEICKYNIATDDTSPPRAALFHPEWHFTNEKFAESSSGLIGAKNLAVARLQGWPSPFASEARKELGRALHTLQDFYSHSNWVELGGGGLIYEALGREIVPDPPSYLRPCPNRSNVLEGDGLLFLTSAYYGPLAASFQALCGCGDAPAGKCFHGNYGDSKCAGKCSSDATIGINKDRFRAADPFFLGAYLSAVKATEDYMQQVIELLQRENDERALAALLGVSGVGFAIDTTGSMAPYLETTKRSAISLASLLVQQEAKPASTFVLVPFNDPSVGPVSVTTDASTFSNAVGALTATGGGDCPELAYAAMELAIASLPPDSQLYVFTDAAAKDVSLSSRVHAAARAKHIGISFANSVYCAPGASPSGSPNDPSDDAIALGRVATALAPSADYAATAAATGGAVYDLSSAATADYSSLMLPGALGRSQVVLSRLVTAPEEPAAGFGPSMVYDTARGVAVLFGGGTSGVFSNETWERNATTWTLRAVTGPSARAYHAMAYDSVRGVAVLFGGSNTSSVSNNETWEWNGTTWNQRATAGPSARWGHKMVYDSARRVTVLFGGFTSAGVMSNETWEWNGTTWTLRSTSGPSGRYVPAMTYDSTRGVTVLFGGSNSSGVSNSETWEWNGTAWVQRTATGPSARSVHAMAFDAARGVSVLFGGRNSSGVSNSETWEWNGSAWNFRTSTVPSARYGHAMAYDAVRRVTVLFGGGTSTGLNDTWEWNGTAWALRRSTSIIDVPIDTTSSMQVRVLLGSASLFDPSGTLVTAATAGARVQILGMSTIYTVASPIAGLWSIRIDDAAWVQVVVDSDIALADAAFVTDNSAVPEGLHGGYAPIADLPLAGEIQILKATLLGAHASAQFSLVDEFGTLIAPVNLTRNYPGAVEDDYLGTMTLPAEPFRLVATGVTADGRAFRREFGTLFRGVPFRVLPPAQPPSLDPGGGRGLYEFKIENRGAARTLFVEAVGVPGTAIAVTPAIVTVPANGTQSVFVSNPTPCYAFADGTAGTLRLTAFDVLDNKLSNSAAVDISLAPASLRCLRSLSYGAGVLFGGFTGTPNGETWEWNGNAWALRPLTGPSARSVHAMAFDAARGVTTLFGGGTSSGLSSETWEWNGNAWNQRATTGPSARYVHAMAYDAARRATVLFGGATASDVPNGETWEWNGTSWSQRATTGPSARFGHAMAYDAARGVTVLFGGGTSTSFGAGTWEWNGTSWSQRATTGPSARFYPAMAYDALRGVTVLFGGNTATGWSNETWEWNGVAWTLRATTGPSARGVHAMVYDATRGVTSLFGGNTSAGVNGETWEWNGTAWTQLATAGPSARYGHAMTYSTVSFPPIRSVRLAGIRVSSTIDLVESPALASVALEDDSGAITVSGSNAMIQSILAAAASGNVLASISGTVTDSNGLRQLVDVTSVTPGNRSETVRARIVQPSDFADQSSTAEELESHIVVLDNYSFAQGGPFAVGTYVNGGVTVRVSTAALAAAFNAQFGSVPTGFPLRLTGVFSQDDTSPPFNGGYQLLVTTIEKLCPADFDHDGFLTFEDFDAFVGAFESGAATADFNSDGFLTFEDFDAFVAAFEAGC
jgi:hypothetical protein